MNARVNTIAHLSWAVLLAFTLSGAVSVAKGDDAFSLSSGVVLDSGSGAVYLARPGGGIESLDVSTGTLRWSSADADLPLLVFGDSILAWREQRAPGGAALLEIVAIDRDDGGEQFLISTGLAEGIWNHIENGLGKQFTVRAWNDGPVVRVAWKSAQQTVGGMRSSTSAVAILEQVFRIDFANRRLIVEAIAVPAVGRPDVPTNERLPGLSSAQFVSADNLYVLATEHSADDQRFDSYQWVIASRTDGEILGVTTHFSGYSPFGVVGTQLVHQVRPHARRIGNGMKSFPLSLRAVELTTGDELWFRQVRDTAYKGSYPP